MTEPGAGSDLQGMRTTATKDGDYFVLNGSKTYITNGWHSDMVIVCAKTDVNAKGSRGISLFLVDANTPGFVKGRKLNKLGLKVTTNSIAYNTMHYSIIHFFVLHQSILFLKYAEFAYI